MSQSPAQFYFDFTKWAIGGLLGVVITGFGVVSKWEHDRITELEQQRVPETVRLVRMEEKIDVLNWKLEKLAALAEKQAQSKQP